MVNTSCDCIRPWGCSNKDLYLRLAVEVIHSEFLALFKNRSIKEYGLILILLCNTLYLSILILILIFNISSMKVYNFTGDRNGAAR